MVEIRASRTQCSATCAVGDSLCILKKKKVERSGGIIEGDVEDRKDM